MNTTPANQSENKKQPAQLDAGQAERHGARQPKSAPSHEMKEKARRSFGGYLGTFEPLVLKWEGFTHVRRS